MSYLDEVFAAFWAPWPKKVKRQRAHDAVRWALQNHDTPQGVWLEAALKTIAWQKKFYGDPKYFPDPDRWILDMRWTDEEPVKESKPMSDFDRFREERHQKSIAQQMEWARRRA